MTAFTICIAERVIAVTALYDSTREFCRDYLCWGTPEFSVAVTPADIEYEREKSAREDAAEGIPTRQFPDAYLERLAVYRKIADRLTARDTILFHGSAIAVDGVGYLFTAKSGTGKSTHTRLWREVFGERAMMINDDKPLLQVGEQGVRVFGTPWDGKHRLSTNTAVPLKAICILERGAVNRICPISAQEALPMLLQQSHRPAAPDALLKLLELMDNLTKQVLFYRLTCTMELDAALTAYAGMQE